MRNDLEKHKLSDSVKWIFTAVLILLLILSVFAIITKGFKVLKPTEWFKSDKPNTDITTPVEPVEKESEQSFFMRRQLQFTVNESEEVNRLSTVDQTGFYNTNSVAKSKFDKFISKWIEIEERGRNVVDYDMFFSEYSYVDIKTNFAVINIGDTSYECNDVQFTLSSDSNSISVYLRANSLFQSDAPAIIVRFFPDGSITCERFAVRPTGVSGSISVGLDFTINYYAPEDLYFSVERFV